MIRIIRRTDLDLAALQRLLDASSAEGFRFLVRFCEEWTSGENRFDAAGEALFLAFANDQLAGICGLNRDPYSLDARVGRVRRLYVLPEYRRCGVGGTLLDAVIAHARGFFDLLRVRTEVAGSLYISRGFRCIDCEPDATHVLELTDAAH